MWWQQVKDYTWDEFKRYKFHSRLPDDYILLDLIKKEPGDPYFDKQGTTGKENAMDIVYAAFSKAVDNYRKSGDKIKWGDHNRVNIMHMINIPQFSRMNIASAGHFEAINAQSDNWGPSWRMIVELGDRPRAFGIYPGGQSGNVGSRNYDNFIGDWNKGNYYPLQYFISKEEAGKQVKQSWVLK